MPRFKRRFRFPWRTAQQINEEIDAEVEFHLEMRTQELIERGMSPADARLEARRQFGSVPDATQYCRDLDLRVEHRLRWIRFFDEAGKDAAYGARKLGRSPGFTAVAALTLALGIGASTAIFSVINTFLLRPPPFADLDRLVQIWETHPQSVPPDEAGVSQDNFLNWKRRSRSFDMWSGWRNWYYVLAGPEDSDALAEQVRGVQVSASFFGMLGVEPALGRGFLPGEDERGADRVVVLSDSLWQRRFARDPEVLGEQLVVDGRPFTVIGVLPPDFYMYQPDFELWMPLPEDPSLHTRDDHSLLVTARLAPTVGLADARDEMATIAEELAAQYPETNRGFGVNVVPLYPSRQIRESRPALLVLLGGVGLLLLIACTNVANLLLVRGVARQRELAIRGAIGASRGRLIRQLLVENMLLALLSGGAGLVVAQLSLRLIAPYLPVVAAFGTLVPSLDLGVLGFTLALTLTTAVLFGMIPAASATRRPQLQIAPTGSRRSVGRSLLTAEIALAMVLLVAAGLLLESFRQLHRIDPGFDPADRLTMRVWLPAANYPDPSDIERFYREALRRLEAVPGVAAASAVNIRPFLGFGVGADYEIEGWMPPDPTNPTFLVQSRVVSPAYFTTLGVPHLSGRPLAERDGPETAGVVLVNEALAQRMSPNASPIGMRLRVRASEERVPPPWAPTGSQDWMRVVGVVGNVQEFGLTDEPRPIVYQSYRQNPSRFMHLVVQTEGEHGGLGAAIAATIRSVDAQQAPADVQLLDAALANSLAQPRLQSLLLTVFAAVALGLSAIGIFGVMGYAVSRRGREFAIRIALGARLGDIVVSTAGELARVVVAGIGCGLIGSLVLARTLGAFLYGVAPTDGRILLVAAVVVGGVTVVAAWGPVRRATRVAPAAVLRTE